MADLVKNVKNLADWVRSRRVRVSFCWMKKLKMHRIRVTKTGNEKFPVVVAHEDLERGLGMAVDQVNTILNMLADDDPRKKAQQQMHEVFCQKWEESESGWGCRPDGYSLHLTRGEIDLYIKKHGENLRKMYGDRVPHEYDRPDGTPYKCKVDQATFDQLMKDRGAGGFGMRKSGRPPAGGTDGWMPVPGGASGQVR